MGAQDIQVAPPGAFTPAATSRMGLGLQRQTQRAIHMVQAEGVVAAVREEGRAFLGNRALENIGALTALEQHLITVAPLGEARYREIVDSVTLGAASAIRRFGN